MTVPDSTIPAPIVGDQRKYHVTGILGQGGFGTVYRARLEGSEGFQKDVAIKILRDAEPPQDILARFRDEARILGLVRNPHVVSVDPPVKLGGRWAVVMEYVDGASCEEMLHVGVFPPSIVLEIAETIAETLVHLYEAEDDQGRPLNLVHRDLKPSNIQVTPRGHLKLLDFGVARAEFERRETETVAQIGGTPGYIAPERLEGHDGPEGDIYSLGVVMHRLVTRQRPPPINASMNPGPSSLVDPPSKLGNSTLLADPRVKAVVELAAELRNPDHTVRPKGREVAERCRTLRSTFKDAPNLRDWAKDQIATAPRKPPDEMVGRTISETMSHVSRRMLLAEAEAQRPPEQDPWLAVGLASVLFGLFIAFLGLVMVAGLGAYYVKDPSGFARLWSPGTDAPTEVVSSGTAPVDPNPAAVPVAPEPSDPVPPPVATDDAVVAAPTGTPEPAPTVVSKPEPRPEPKPEPVAQPTPEPVGSGVVQVTGDATSVQLRCAGKVFGPGATVPAGPCEVSAAFGDGKLAPAGSVTVAAGSTVTVHCAANFQRCRAR